MKTSFISITLLILLASACGDILDKKPESNLSPNQFYNNADDAKAAVGAVYDLLNSDLYNQVMWIVQDQSTDDAEWGDGRATANQAKNDLDKYSFTPQTSTFYTLWSTCYRGINRANTAIGRIPAIPLDETLKNRLVAESKFMRGFYYFTLVRLYGGVPLVLAETVSVTNLEIPRASAEEVYQQIINDFTDAESVLPITYATADKGRATKGAAKSFLAKVYLTRSEWSKASDKAKEVIDLAIYDLWTNFAEAFLIANENGKESVFEIQAIGGGFGEGSSMQGFMRATFDRVNGVTGFGDNPPMRNLYRAYRSADKRRNATLKLYSATTSPAAPASVGFPCYVNKYLDPTATANADGGNNFTLIRYPDVLLMYAEALNEQAPNSVEAYSAVNKVRKRAGLANLTPNLSQSQFKDSVLLERRLELAFEGHRRYDLVRTKKLISALNVQNPNIVVQEYHNLFPIPQIERVANIKLDQNTGY
jgi:starch-binding outer membrane protein, SusD/RagB family